MTTPCLNRPTLSLEAAEADLDKRMRAAAYGGDAWGTYAALLGVRREIRIRHALRQDALTIPDWPPDLAEREAEFDDYPWTAEQAAAHLDGLSVPGPAPADPDDDQESFADSLFGVIAVALCAVGVGVILFFAQGW